MRSLNRKCLDIEAEYFPIGRKMDSKLERIVIQWLDYRESESMKCTINVGKSRIA